MSSVPGQRDGASTSHPSRTSAPEAKEMTPVKKISRCLCTLVLSTATVLAITSAPASGSDATPAIASTNAAWVADPTQSRGSTTVPPHSLRIWEW